MTAVPNTVAVLASGRGSNLVALLKARERGELPVDFVLVGSDRADAAALQVAQKAGIATLSLDPRAYPDRQAFDLELFRRIQSTGAHWLVLAGFMRILDGEALRPWVGRIINIHPSLLPKYRGLHTHRRALQAGDHEHGASVHFVTDELDGGPLIAQARIAIEPGDDEQQLAQRLLPLEHRLLPAVLCLLASGKLHWRDEAAHFDGRPLPAPLQMDSSGFLRTE